MEVTRESCEAYADELMVLPEPDRLRKIWEMGDLALREDAPALPILVGLALRDRGIIDWAEYVFQLSLKVPRARGAALFELSVAAAITGRPAESVGLLARLEAEEPLSAYQLRAYSHQLIQLGDLDGAVERLERADELEPWAVREHAAYRQFFEFYRRFPLEEAQRRCAALLGSYTFRSPAELAEDISKALDEDRPYSVIRLNDGEGSVIHLSVSDDAEYSELYARNRREFHNKYWFGDESMVYDPAYNRACRDLNNILADADCLGGYQYHGLPVEYRWASHRNVPCLFNVVRKLEQISAKPGFVPGRIGICDPQVAHPLLFEGHLERLIRKKPRLGVISCHAALPEALKQRFDLSEVFFHKTPGEAKLAEPAEREPFGVWHERLKAEVSGAEPGVLYLVGAGIPGKIYCDIIKRAGGIALDIGAVADIWMQAPTREGIAGWSAHALTA